MTLAIVGAIIFTIILVSGCTSSPGDQSGYQARGYTSPDNVEVTETAGVAIKNFEFLPAEVTISKGGTVTWTNEDSAKHDIKFSDGTSPLLGKGESYSKSFEIAGTFDYICGIHPYMKGKVIVV
ncbi:hypothetical protein CUJ83_14660 [Methanocella sp. CWC-04]|uniref:EfeO-type cupredoxin-like domain-containing protein n=2 Tax=Methanooceanicella nereidis TaxID=2052831 RepID=A0AAP2RGA0_9EURY|nr:hypothetical protein [Methanocella sp. CWC-04]